MAYIVNFFEKEKQSPVDDRGFAFYILTYTQCYKEYFIALGIAHSDAFLCFAI